MYGNNKIQYVNDVDTRNRNIGSLTEIAQSSDKKNRFVVDKFFDYKMTIRI